MIGRGLGTDTYFSLYVQSIIGNARGITVIGTVLALAKLVLVIPVGNLNDHAQVKYLLLLGKMLYVCCALCYFFAGLWLSRELLLAATLLNGFASATTFTTYRSYYGKNARKNNQNQIFGAYFSSSNVAQILGALLSAGLVYYLELPFMYFFVVIFALISLLQDQKIKEVLAKHYHRTRKKLSKIRKYEIALAYEEKKAGQQPFFGKTGFLYTFLQECFSFGPRKRMFVLLKSSHSKMYIALGSMFLVNVLNYIGFLFIPIVAISNHLSLSQIALVFAVMKAPYLVNIFAGKLGDKYNKKLLIALILVFMSFFYVLLGFHDDFAIILVLTFAISLGIALLNPLTSALVSSYTQQKDKGVMAGTQDFVSKLGEVIGSLGFGGLVAGVGIRMGFICVGIAIFVLGIYLLVKKLWKSHNNLSEREEKAVREVHDLGVPVVDMGV
jgi:MFS family permease